MQRSGLSRDELVELARDDIAEALRATPEFPVDRHVIRLTGGKDSRLLLAVTLWAGVAQHFHYETIGPPTLADVRVASELAKDGLYAMRRGAVSWGWPFDSGPPARPRASRFCDLSTVAEEDALDGGAP